MIYLLICIYFNIEYPVLVSVDGKEIPSVHYTRHEAEEPSGLREDIDVYEPTLRGEKDTARICEPNHQFLDFFSYCSFTMKRNL